MGSETESDVYPDINGQCFFCLTKSVTECPPGIVKLEVDEMVKSSSTFHSYPSYSLRYLFFYLSMDTCDYNLSRNNLSHFMTRVDTANLKVQLCKNCAKLNEKFTGLCQKLETIQMEVQSCVSLINGKLTEAGKPEGMDDFSGELDILDELRRETMQRCSTKVTQTLPRVKLTRVNIKNVQSHTAPYDEMDIKVENISGIYMDLTTNDEGDYLEYPDQGQDQGHSSKPFEAEEGVLGNPEMDEVEDLLQINDTLNESKNVVRQPKTRFLSSQKRSTKRKPVSRSQTPYEEMDIKVEAIPDIHLDLTTHDEGGYLEDPNQDQGHSSQSLEGGECVLGNPEMDEIEDLLQINDPLDEAKNAISKPKSRRSRKRKLIGREQKAKCKECGKVFSNPYYILRHHQTAHQGLRFPCNLCNKHFTTKYHLESHVQTFHFNLPKFNCDICGQGFCQKGHVTTHINEVHLKLRKDHRIKPNLD